MTTETLNTSEALQQSFVAILNKTVSGVEDGVSFLSQEIPEVVEQLILFNLVWESILAGIYLLIIGISIGVTYRIVSWCWWTKDCEWSDENKQICTAFSFLGGGALTTIFLINIILTIKEITMLALAPKLYLIEYTAELLK